MEKNSFFFAGLSRASNSSNSRKQRPHGEIEAHRQILFIARLVRAGSSQQIGSYRFQARIIGHFVGKLFEQGAHQIA